MQNRTKCMGLSLETKSLEFESSPRCIYIHNFLMKKEKEYLNQSGTSFQD